jgi:hypothetical protein
MSASMKNKLAELRRLKEESNALQSRIINQQAQMQHQVAVQSRLRTTPQQGDNGHMDSYSLFLRRLNDPDLIGNMVIQDFNRINEHAIENKLRVQRSRVLINNLMSEADVAYQDKIACLAIDDISDRQHAESMVEQKHRRGKVSNIKRVIVTPQQNAESRDDEESSSEVEPLDESIDEETRWHVNQYINRCYELIIKVVKVYIIRASMRGYLLPTQREVDNMKARLEGHMLIPRSKRKSLYTGCRIYYMDIVDACPNYTGDFTAKCVEAWVVRQRKGRVLVTTDKYFCKPANRVSSQGQVHCMKVINFKYPIFRKLTDNDIQRECIANIPPPAPIASSSESESEYSSAYELSETEPESEDEYQSEYQDEYAESESENDNDGYKKNELELYYDSDSTITEFEFSDDENG